MTKALEKLIVFLLFSLIEKWLKEMSRLFTRRLLIKRLKNYSNSLVIRGRQFITVVRYLLLTKLEKFKNSDSIQKSVIYICVSFSVLHIGLSLPSF